MKFKSRDLVLLKLEEIDELDKSIRIVENKNTVLIVHSKSASISDVFFEQNSVNESVYAEIQSILLEHLNARREALIKELEDL